MKLKFCQYFAADIWLTFSSILDTFKQSPQVQYATMKKVDYYFQSISRRNETWREFTFIIIGTHVRCVKMRDSDIGHI